MLLEHFQGGKMKLLGELKRFKVMKKTMIQI
jgi:hypothetical protein